MNAAHWHLLLNHIPVIGVWLGVGWLLAAVALRNPTLIRASWVTFIVCAALTIPVYLTGEPAESVIEHMPGVTEKYIHQHETMAKITLIGVEALGLLSLVSLFASRRRDTLMRPLSLLSLAAALLCAGLAGYTANLGGQIRHTEIRPDSAAVVPGTAAPDSEDAGDGRGRGRERD
jgi:uncharacterized membrane protein